MYKINTEVVSSKLGDQIIVLNIETGKYYQLDGTSAYIWNLLEDPKTKEQLKEEIEKRFMSNDRIDRDLESLLHYLRSEKLIDKS